MADRPQQFVVPNLCTATALSLVVLFAQLLVLVLWVAGSDLSWLRFALLSFYVQWVALTCAGALCLLRGWLATLPVAAGALVAFGVVMLVAFTESLLADRLLVGFDGVAVNWLDVARSSLIAGIIGGLVLRYFYVQQRLRVQEQAELQSRIQALQSRIRPHFLFNSMNIIASLIATDPDTAETVVEDLSDLFRASLNDAGNQVPLADELDLCERYVRIEALRLGDRLKMDWQIEGELDNVRIPLLTLQPLLENAIYHGIQPRADGGTVHVGVQVDDQRVRVRIDNPLPQEGERGGSSGNRMALDNIRSRLQVLYGERAWLTAEEAEHRFVTTLQFPLNEGGFADR